MALDGEIEKFLRREFAKEREVPIHKVKISHAAAGTRGNDIETFDVSFPMSDQNISMMADDIISRSQLDADGQGGTGVQRYVISLHVKGEIRSVGRFSYKMKSSGDEFEDAGDEPANARGLVSQLMRHNEAIAKIMVTSLGGVVHHQTRQLESANETIERLTRINAENNERLEAANSQAHDRDMELMKENAKQERDKLMFDKLSLMVPVVINRLAGQKVFDSEDPNAMMLRTFAESMSADQFNKIRQTLSQEQVVLLMQIMQATQQKKLPPNSTPNGAAS